MVFVPSLARDKRYNSSEGENMPYITIHRLIAPMIAAGNREWREMMRHERADPVAQFKANGGRVKKIPYQGDNLPLGLRDVQKLFSD